MLATFYLPIDIWILSNASSLIKTYPDMDLIFVNYVINSIEKCVMEDTVIGAEKKTVGSN